MFVSTPPQISADAAQTGFIGPSAPATAGSDGGFAAWLPGNLPPTGEMPTGATPLQGAAGAGGTVPPLPFSPFGLEIAQGTLGQLIQGTAETSGATGFQKSAGTPADLLVQTALLNQAGPQGEAQANQTAKPLTGQHSLVHSGAELSLMSGQKSGTAAPSTQSDADTTETMLNRFGMPAMAKEVTDPLTKRAASASAGAETFASTHRASSDTLSQGQTQLAALPQSTDNGFRSQLSQGGISQSQGQDGAGKPNPTINSADIAVQMARNKADGNNQFTIRLTPESMGTITVKLNITNNTNLTAQLQVEKPETLALLQKDLAGLEKALKAQGFSTGDGDLTVSLKASSVAVRGGEAAMNSGTDQRFGQGQNMGQNQSQTQNPTQNQTQGQTAAQNQASNSAAQQTPSQPPPSGGMDRPAPGMLLSSGDMGFQQSHHERGAQGHEGFDHHSNGHDQPEPDDLDAAQLEHADLIANAYHGQSLLIGMSTQLDLSV